MRGIWIRHGVLVLLAGVLLLGCSAHYQGAMDATRSGQWAYGVPFTGLRFDRERYLTDAEYRAGFEYGLANSRGANFPTYRDTSGLVREMLRLDELNAQIAAREAAQAQPITP